MLAAYEASADLAERHGPLPAWQKTRTARGVLHPDHYDVEPTWPERWAALRARIAATGMRNSLLLAIAPTATIASIAGVYECIEPQVSNLFKRETLSGEFLQVNAYLVEELKRLGRVGRADPRGAARGERLGAGASAGSRADVRGAVPHGVGDPAARPDRHGRGPHAVSWTRASR